MIDSDFLAAQNASDLEHLNIRYDELGDYLARRGQSIEQITQKVMTFEMAVPSWGVGTGGTRFARFPGPGEPRNIFEKLEDCAVIETLMRACPSVSPHFPWDDTDDWSGLSERAKDLGLRFDAVNSNTFQDQIGQDLSYKFGSLTHTDKRVREQAIAHNLQCIQNGIALGSKALTVWIADGSNVPGQQDFTGALERYLESMKQIYAGLPDDWQVFIEHKLFEPAFYSTVISDWGTSILSAQTLGPKAKCLVDLGHHAPNTNIEMIVARVHQFGKLGGFHFNDSKYGDDDLDSGSIDPFQLFLVFNELVKAEARSWGGPPPAYMMDQSHNLTDPIESLMTSAEAILLAYAQALIIDREKLENQQAENDVLACGQTLKAAFRTDVRPIVEMARQRAGGAIDPVKAYRASDYRAEVSETRPPTQAGGGGIV
ncbi:MAG: L-rhamnose catabolism isomerase [Pseudomonadota bacterium]